MFRFRALCDAAYAYWRAHLTVSVVVLAIVVAVLTESGGIRPPPAASPPPQLVIRAVPAPAPSVGAELGGGEDLTLPPPGASPPPKIILRAAPAPGGGASLGGMEDLTLPRPPGPPPVFADGRKAGSVTLVAPTKMTVFDWVGARLGLPVGDIAVVESEPQKGETLRRKETASLFLYTVDASGTVRAATPKAWALFNEVWLTGLILLLGAGFVLLRNDFDRYFYDPDRGKALAGLAIAALFAVRLHYAVEMQGLQAALLAVAVVTIDFTMRSKARWAAATLAAYAAVTAFRIEIVPPDEALRGMYGVLGIYFWDVAALATFAVAVPLGLLLTRRPRLVNRIHVSTGNAVQDVRIVEDRAAR